MPRPQEDNFSELLRRVRFCSVGYASSVSVCSSEARLGLTADACPCSDADRFSAAFGNISWKHRFYSLEVFEMALALGPWRTRLNPLDPKTLLFAKHAQLTVAVEAKAAAHNPATCLAGQSVVREASAHFQASIGHGTQSPASQWKDPLQKATGKQ
jgi:hypothetical protein